MIGIILFIVIFIAVLAYVRITQGCFFRPMFRDDVECYTRKHGLSDRETIEFINDNRCMIRCQSPGCWNGNTK